LKGKHIKDGKEILAEVVKDTAEAKAKIAAHLTKLMADLKAAGIADPLNNLEKNPAWQNWTSPDLTQVHVSTKSDEMNMYMEIFKALNLSSKSSNINLADECKHMLAQNALQKLIAGSNDSALKDMQNTFAANAKAVADAKSDDSFWGVFTRVLTDIVVAVIIVAAIAAAPVSGGGSLVGAGLLAATALGTELTSELYIQPKVVDANTVGSATNDANAKNAQATTDLSAKITMNANSIQVIQNTIQADSQQEQSAESDKEASLSVAKAVIQAMTKSAAAV